MHVNKVVWYAYKTSVEKFEMTVPLERSQEYLGGRGLRETLVNPVKGE
jgi:hypothetical protein